MQSTKRSVFPLKKSIALIMALSVLVCGVFAACSSKKTDGQNTAADTTQAGLANADTEFGTEINKDGKEVDVVYEKDKKGKNHAYEIDKNGEKVTKSNGDYVEVPIEDDNNNNGNDNNDKENGNGGNNNGGNGNENLKPNPVTPQEPDNKGETTGVDDYYIIMPDVEQLKAVIREMVRRFETMGIRVNKRKCKIIPLTKSFRWCKARFTLTETGKVKVNGSRDGIKRARRKLKLFHQEFMAGKRPFSEVEQYMECQSAYYRNFNDHGRLLRLRRLYHAIFFGGAKCIKS